MDRPRTPTRPASPFRSFWMGGFEGADHINIHGVPLDMAQLSGHWSRLDADYADAAALGFGTLRESVGWRLTEPEPSRFDFTRVRRIAAAAERHGVQPIWTLMHYGTPADLDLHDDRIIERFAAFAAAAATAIGEAGAAGASASSELPPVYNPINEIGFLAWAASEEKLLAGSAGSQRDPTVRASTEISGYDVKRRLVRAVLAAIEAIRVVDPRARFVHVEPLVHVVAPRDRPDLADLAERVSGYQWQTWDLLAGLTEPGLGGSKQALDMLGVNHYHSGQWEVGTEERLLWHRGDPRRRPLSAMMIDAYERYRRPMIVAESSHFGAGRVPWLDEIAAEVIEAKNAGVPVDGLCLYPIVDRPDWNDLGHWHNSGVWDADSDGCQDGKRLHRAYADAIASWQTRLM